MKTLIRRRVLSGSVLFACPKNGTLGLYGLNWFCECVLNNLAQWFSVVWGWGLLESVLGWYGCFDLVIWYHFHRFCFGFRMHSLDLFGCMCDAVVSDEWNEVVWCVLDGILVLLGWGFLSFCFGWYGLVCLVVISCGMVCIGSVLVLWCMVMFGSDVCKCCVFVYVGMHVMSDKWCYSGILWWLSI